MEGSINQYVKRLVELDSASVELNNKRQKEILQLELQYKNELDTYKKGVKSATKLAKEKRKQVLMSAKNQEARMKEKTSIDMKKIDKKFTVIKENMVQKLWDKIILDFIEEK